MLGCGFDRGGRRDRVRRLAHRRPVGGHPAGGDGGLRPGAAFEQAARDQKAIGALAGGHGNHPLPLGGGGGSLPDELHRLAADVLAESLECLMDDAFGIEPGLGVHRVRQILVEEDIGQHHAANLEPAIEQTVLGERLQHERAEAADRTSSTVNSTSCSRASRNKRSTSSGLAKRASATVVDRPCAANSSAAFRHWQDRAPYRTAQPGTFAQDAALTDLERPAFFRHRHAAAFAARIAQRRRPIVDRHGGGLPCAPARLRRPPPSARSPAGGRDRRCRRRRHASARRHRPVRRGPWRSAPATAGSPRRARPGHQRAAGTSNRWSRTA